MVVDTDEINRAARGYRQAVHNVAQLLGGMVSPVNLLDHNWENRGSDDHYTRTLPQPQALFRDGQHSE
jgi:hypothetical protein